VAIVVAAILETLGLTTMHTALWSYDWNNHKRKTDPRAPVLLAVALGAVNVVATWGLVVFLEVWPVVASYAPALFPALAVVGALNLAMISRQEQREAAVWAEKAERRRRRLESGDRSKGVLKIPPGSTHEQGLMAHSAVQNSVLDAVNRTRRERKARMLDAMLDIYVDSPDAGATEVARRLGIGRSTVYNYLKDLEAAKRIARDGNGVEVLETR
jgi:hypothetical protein